jgi:hypothetical protein
MFSRSFSSCFLNRQLGLNTPLITPLLGLSWGHVELALRQRCSECGERLPNGLFCGMLLFDCFDSICLMFFVETTSFHSFLASVRLPTVFDKFLDWVEATLDSLCTEMWRTAEQRCTHFSRRSHRKPTHVSVFCDSLESICLVEWSKAYNCSFYCTVCAHSRLYTSLSIMVEPPVPLNWKKTASLMIF